MELNNKQKQIIEADEDRILVLSAAAVGKTRCITERIKHLLEKGIDPSKIVAFSFTNMAAEEMKKRLPNVPQNLYIGTIHGYANKICLSQGIDTYNDIASENFQALIEKASKLGKSQLPEIEHMLVDEFQDICPHEFNFFNKLRPKNFCCLGDARQAIYGFKGATDKYFKQLYQDPNCKKYFLTDNYRNAPNIIDFADDFLRYSNNIGPNAKPMKKNEGLIEECSFSEAFDNLRLTSKRKDWVVLCRTNAEVAAVQNMLDKDKIPNITFKKKDLSLKEMETLMTQDAIKVLTIHSFKGLESPFVIVIGAKIYNEEERRISYVAATRAMNILYWCPSLPKSVTNGIKRRRPVDNDIVVF